MKSDSNFNPCIRQRTFGSISLRALGGAAALAVIIVLLVVFGPSKQADRPGQTAPSHSASEALVAAVKQLESERKRADETTWREEVEAERYEAEIVLLWDRLRQQRDLSPLIDLHLDSVRIPSSSQSVA